MGLNDIISNNHYPILFVGSGMSKRYLEDSPTWIDLLEEYWKKIEPDEPFYSKLHDIEKDIENEHSNYLIYDTSFERNTRIASFIESKFSDLFFKQKILVDGLDLKKASLEQLSPFKVDLANRFADLKRKNDLNEEEFNLFQKAVQKAKMVITTNYDTLIEESIKSNSKQNPKIYIGNSGFFDSNSIGWSEIYKIHGSCSDPSSIVINKEDYNKFDQNSVLISAKILSSMIQSPIIFLGYSLEDENVRKLLQDFSRELPKEDSRKSANRIFIVEYSPGESELVETIQNDSLLNLTYTHIKTDNYSELFKKIISIDEGVTPYEVRRFQDIIGQIIVSAGHKKALNSYLISPKNIDELEHKIAINEPIVVALGNTKNIYVNPTDIDYLTDYINQKFELYPESALRFIAKAQSRARYPLFYHYNSVDIDKTNLDSVEKKRIRDRVKEYSQDFKILDSIRLKKKYVNVSYDSIQDIISLQEAEHIKIDLITQNSQHIDKRQLTQYVQKEALPLFVKYAKEHNQNHGVEKTALRRLFVVWDILMYKD
ncbi:SIR2 family protein [Ligilactobacillus salivarius]|uniref:SIR2 family protein n=1 Tax=Ligilactobacillus salivarius TaxID=1624 RepID=UPI0009DA6CD2|nr:SIR2 family protein [Ligilactobacillus salivarius]OQR00526.1 hypothetical protein B6U48_08440 [Ligilactobacillus salivarius]